MNLRPVSAAAIFLIAAIFFLGCLPAHAGPWDWTSSEKLSLNLARGSFVVLHYPARLSAPGSTPKAVILFGSGCTGWTYWEETVSCYLQAQGYEVLGLDFAFYSAKDYDLKTLAKDCLTIAQTYAKNKLPVILAGWSTGAEQVVAAASGLPSTPNLAGLLLVSPGNTGGYGPCATNYIFWNVPASKLFSLTDLAPRMPHVRIVQWHAEFDPLDSTAWLSRLSVPHQEHDFPNAIHDFHGACPAFLSQLDASISWILQKKGPLPAIAMKPPHAGGQVAKAKSHS